MELCLTVATVVVIVLVAVVVRLVQAENTANRQQNARAAVYFATRDAAYQQREAALDQMLTRR